MGVGGEDESIEAAAAARREKLRALRAAQELLNTPDDDQDEEENADGDANANANANVNMKFRNYLPHDKQLQEGKLAPPVLSKFEDPVLAAPPPPQDEREREDPFLNIAPKKPNWDLRRDVQKRLDKLERLTHKAMLTLMEREQAKGKSEDTENGGED